MTLNWQVMRGRDRKPSIR